MIETLPATGPDAGIRVEPVALVAGVDAWFTGRGPRRDADIGPGERGNLAHRRPHVPAQLARDRAEVAGRMDLDPLQLHWMRQIHGNAVGVVDETTPPGAQLADVDALVTRQTERALVVQVADCVPILLAVADGPIAAVHAGRRGVASGVLDAALEVMRAPFARVHAAVGPAIGGCCYEVPAELAETVTTAHPAARATTTWGTPSLDLPAAILARLEQLGVAKAVRVGGCTRCDPQRRWFSHRADPDDAGRQAGVIVRRQRPVEHPIESAA